jgi:tRNA pseudouridine38-40 synthase
MTPPLRRLALGIEYDGGAFSGWQSQRRPELDTIQEALEAALGRVADHSVSTVCAGRTDAGVHARAQVVHFDTTACRPERAWVLGTNAHLPRGVSVQWAKAVPEAFHARFSAVSRSYRYLLLNRRQRSALWADRCWQLRQTLDVQLMERAGQALLGEQDFSAFRGSGCQSRTPMRKVESLRVTRAGDCVAIDIRANAFLLHMVRNITGALVRVGTGERTEDWIATLLASRDRRQAAETAPPQGLYLVAVAYAAEWGLPASGWPPETEGILPA